MSNIRSASEFKNLPAGTLVVYMCDEPARIFTLTNFYRPSSLSKYATKFTVALLTDLKNDDTIYPLGFRSAVINGFLRMINYPNWVVLSD